MNLYELFETYKDQLTDKARRFIENSDYEAIKDLGNNWTVANFENFIKDFE